MFVYLSLPFPLSSFSSHFPFIRFWIPWNLTPLNSISSHLLLFPFISFFLCSFFLSLSAFSFSLYLPLPIFFLFSCSLLLPTLSLSLRYTLKKKIAFINLSLCTWLRDWLPPQSEPHQHLVWYILFVFSQLQFWSIIETALKKSLIRPIKI